ncbi:MAG: glycosyltransferase [Acidimicrobiia bacterium]|nr:glycosyltransferase [Acidimicrobiia bacterium]
MTMTQPQITIIIPVHNEAGFMGSALARIREQVETVTPRYRIILVENGSTDRTHIEALSEAASDSRLDVIQIDGADYGLAIRTGMKAAGDLGWLVVFDIDYHSGEFLQRVAEFGGSADVVIASKRAPGSRDRRPWIRRLATRVFNLALRTVVGSGLTDTHGIKALSAPVVQEILPRVRLTEDLFDTELVLRAERAGYRIVEVPITVEELREARSSLLRRVPRTLRGLITLRRSLGSG